jgi:hypothetical protein
MEDVRRDTDRYTLTLFSTSPGLMLTFIQVEEARHYRRQEAWYPREVGSEHP